MYKLKIPAIEQIKGFNLMHTNKAKIHRSRQYGVLGIVVAIFAVANIATTPYTHWWFYVIPGLALILFSYLRIMQRDKKMHYILIGGIILFLILYKIIEYRVLHQNIIGY